MLHLVEAIRRLWFLFLAFFRSDSKNEDPTVVLPVFSNCKTRLVGDPELSSPRQERPMQQRGSASGLISQVHCFLISNILTRSGIEKGNDVRHPASYANPNLRAFYLPLDRSSNRHPQTRDDLPGREYTLILPDSMPPPRPPRPRSISVVSKTSVSDDEFSTPIIPNAFLPAVIVTPCTPSSQACRSHAGSRSDESSSDENGASSESDTSCIASGDSNPFLIDLPSPLQKKAAELPPSSALDFHRRARSLTGNGRRTLSKVDSLALSSSSLSLMAATAVLSNPVKNLDGHLLIDNPVIPSIDETSLVCSRLDLSRDSESQAIADQLVRLHMRKKSEGSSDVVPLTQNVIVDTTIATTTSTHQSEALIAALDEDATAVLTDKKTKATNQLITPSNSAPSVHRNPHLGAVPYPEVFDLDAYLDSNSSQSTLQSFSNSSGSITDTAESQTPTGPSPTCPSSPIPEPLRRISNLTDTTASTTSIYALSLSNLSTDTDESASSDSQRFSHGRRSRVTFDREVSVKRYRDHYRPPAYSRPPAFVVESPTTSRKFVGKTASVEISVGSANKENELIESATNCTLDSTPTSRTIGGTGKSVTILGSFAIVKRRQMDIFL